MAFAELAGQGLAAVMVCVPAWIWIERGAEGRGFVPSADTGVGLQVLEVV